LRIFYGIAALMLLAQPAMFDAAIWFNAVGVIIAVAAIAREILQGRAQPRPASPAGVAVMDTSPPTG
jgi:hypothetical protein